MRVLAVTGRIAEPLLKRVAEQLRGEGIEVESLVVGEVAALMREREILERISKLEKLEYDLILLPGYANVDAKVVEKAAGVPTFRGPRHLVDLPRTLRAVREGLKLSQSIPACELLPTLEIKKLEALIADAESGIKPSFELRGVPVGKGLRPRVVAEIVDAPLLPVTKVLKIAERFAEDADVLDVGMCAGREKPKAAKRLVKLLKEHFELPISIDTISPVEVEAALEAEVDLVLSLTDQNLEEAGRLVADADGAAVIAASGKSCAEKVGSCLKLLERARGMGIRKLICDLVLSPPNQPSFLESLLAYHSFAQREPDVPLMLGIGNVTELVDADSTGLNALLLGIAVELGASLVLTAEASRKTKGCVREAAVASKLMFLSKLGGQPPKDLEFNLLVAKEKACRTLSPSLLASNLKVVKARRRLPRIAEDRVHFRLTIDEERREILVVCQKDGRDEVAIRGGSKEEILAEVLARYELSPQHLIYLTGELQKAETALRLGRSYAQDEKV